MNRNKILRGGGLIVETLPRVIEETLRSVARKPRVLIHKTERPGKKIIRIHMNEKVIRDKKI